MQCGTLREDHCQREKLVAAVVRLLVVVGAWGVMAAESVFHVEVLLLEIAAVQQESQVAWVEGIQEVVGRRAFWITLMLLWWKSLVRRVSERC